MAGKVTSLSEYLWAAIEKKKKNPATFLPRFYFHNILRISILLQSWRCRRRKWRSVRLVEMSPGKQNSAWRTSSLETPRRTKYGTVLLKMNCNHDTWMVSVTLLNNIISFNFTCMILSSIWLHSLGAPDYNLGSGFSLAFVLKNKEELLFIITYIS